MKAKQYIEESIKVFLQKPILIFMGLAIMIRWFSFYPLEIDHDESTYVVIAKGLLEGKVYLIDLIDTKPIGIFWIYAGLLWIAGSSLFFIKFFAALVVGLTAWYLNSIAWQISGNKGISIASGIFYILLTSFFSRWGLGPNTELYFNLFNVAAIHFSLFTLSRKKFILAGMLFGIAFQIKYVAVTEALALGLFLIILSVQSKESLLEFISKVASMICGFILPAVIVLIYFNQHQALESYYFLNWKVSSNYSSSMDLVSRIRFFGDYFLRFFMFSFPAIFYIVSKEFKSSKYKYFFLFWLLLDVLIIGIPGKYFEHYFIQLMPWTALCAALFFTTSSAQPVFSVTLRTFYLPLLSLLAIVLMIAHYFSFVTKQDKLAILTKELSGILKPNDRIYTGNTYQLLYFTLDKESPTPYIHSTLLWNKEHRRALSLDVRKEAEKILYKKPEFMILSEPVQDSVFRSLLLERYKFEKELSFGINLYKAHF